MDNLNNNSEPHDMGDVQELWKRKSAEIQAAAKVLYDNLTPGSTIKFVWVESPTIIGLNGKPKKYFLQVSKPSLDCTLTFQIER